MSTQSPVVPFDLPIRCFSEISNVRCQGITKIQQIGSYIPVALLIFILPFLLLSTYKIPRATLLLLGIELITQLGVHGWNLGYVLDRPTFNNFKSTDTALAIVSATPILIYLLALTSHLLSDIRPHLPFSLQGKVSTVLFAVVVSPLIPLSYVASLLGGFVFVRHRSIRGLVFLDFGDIIEDWVNLVLTSIGTIAALGYILFISLLAFIVLLHPPSTFAYLTTAPSLFPLVLSTLSILLSSGEIALGLVPLDSISPLAGGIIIIVRSCLLLVSRAGLVAGLIIAYQQVEVTRQRRSGIFIGGPMRGTFRKLDEQGTRDFYVEPRVGGKSRDEGTVLQPGRVVLRPPGRHAPQLSFTSSAFAAFRPSTPLGQQSPSDSPQRSRSGRGHPKDPKKVRMNLGSIYAPKRITVNPLAFSQWPPPLAPRPESATLPNLTPEDQSMEKNPFDPPLSADTDLAATPAVRHPAIPRSIFGVSPATLITELASEPNSATAISHSSPSSPSHSPSSNLTPSPAMLSVQIKRTDSSRRKAVPSASTSANPNRLSAPSPTYPNPSFSSAPSQSHLTPRHPSTDTDRGTASPISSYAPSSAENGRTLFYSTPQASPITTANKPYIGGSGAYLGAASGDVGRESREVSWGQVPESATLPSRRDSMPHFARFGTHVRGSGCGSGGNASGTGSGSGLRPRGDAMLASLARLRRETGIAIDVDRFNRESGTSTGMSSMSTMEGLSTAGTVGTEMGMRDARDERLGYGTGKEKMRGLGQDQGVGQSPEPGPGSGGNEGLRVRYSVESMSEISSEATTPRAKIAGLPESVDGHGGAGQDIETGVRTGMGKERGAWWAGARV